MASYVVEKGSSLSVVATARAPNRVGCRKPVVGKGMFVSYDPRCHGYLWRYFGYVMDIDVTVALKVSAFLRLSATEKRMSRAVTGQI